MPAKVPFEELVHRHGATVLRVVRAVVGPVDADDAWSETFLAALRAYPDLSADANLEAWLVTISRRKAIDVTRARARHAIPVADVPDRVAEEHIDGLALEFDLVAAVARLPTKQRRSVTLHYLGGLPYADVADLVGGTESAARRAAADGIRTLRRLSPHLLEAPS